MDFSQSMSACLSCKGIRDEPKSCRYYVEDKRSGKVCDHRPLRDAHSPGVDSTGKRSVCRQAYDFLAGDYVMTPRASVAASLSISRVSILHSIALLCKSMVYMYFGCSLKINLKLKFINYFL